MAGYFRLPVREEVVNTDSQSIFTGATVPITYKDNAHTYENVYVYASQSHTLHIEGLGTKGTVIGNGTKTVTVSFDVSAWVSSFTPFTITCANAFSTRVFKGLYAHYGIEITGILALVYTNVPVEDDTLGTGYEFITTDYLDLPTFELETTKWGGVYSYQILNILIGNNPQTTIPNYFMKRATSYNQPLKITSSYPSTIGNDFMAYCYSHNQPVTIESATSIGNDFMAYCYAYNQPTILPADLEDLGDSFMRGCGALNQEIIIPEGVKALGDNFLRECTALNSRIELQNIVSIGNYFMYENRAFNQMVILSNDLLSIGTHFMAYTVSLNKVITIPTINSVGGYFMYECRALSTLIYNNSVTCPWDIYSLSQTVNSKTEEIYGKGIKILGTGRINLRTALENRTESPYRKLV